ncbi:uncharacterized protein LOC143586529 [Bidens hawaiensis]|uniref:uncharacterized protein LOC143586529 n=1 Tax=Bidens hawaiensis TaxID=980011 RepID=UPI004049E43A
MTPGSSVVRHANDIDVYSCIRNVSVQTGEEFSPEFLRERKPRLERQPTDESFHEYHHTTYATTDQNQQYYVPIVVEKNTYNDHHRQPYPCYNRNNSFSGKLKFLCSFGGKILPRPSDGKLRYVGGETRIKSINKNLSYQQLIKKTFSISNQPHIIKYQLPDEDLDALISVCSNEDLQHMIEEYDELDKSSQRLRIFLAPLNEPESLSSYDSRSVEQSESDYEYVISVNGMTRPSLSKSSSKDLDNLEGGRMDFLTPNVQSASPSMPTRMIEQVNQQPTYENGQQLGRYSGELGGGNHSDISKQYVVWEEDMITWTEPQNLNFCSDSRGALETQYANHSISRTPSSDLMSVSSSRLQHITSQDNVMLSSNLNGRNHCSNDLETLNYNIFSPVSSGVESFEVSLGGKSLSSHNSNCDLPEFPVLVEDVTNNLPHGIPSSTKAVPCILEEPNSAVASQFASADVVHENRLNVELVSGKVIAEVEAGIHGLQIIENSDLEELRELGSGTFGTVYHGKWRGTDVAIKRIRKSCFAGKSSEQERLTKDFWREAQMLSNLHHPNVVALYGVVPDGPGGTLSTVTEYMTNGSLKHVLLKNNRALDWRKKLIIAQDAAIGMEYLHLKKIIHFDLKCVNLLVSLGDPHRPICKVGDFGLSRIKRNTFVSGGVRGTLPWMAPELLNSSSTRVSEKVDVFSFGIAMWEILTEEEPYADMHCGAIIGGIVSNMLRPTIPDQCDERWKGLMEECWSHDPTDRPTFTEITNRLQLIISMASHSKRQNNSNVAAKDLMVKIL